MAKIYAKRPLDLWSLATEGTQELKACPFQLDDYAKFAGELDTMTH